MMKKYIFFIFLFFSIFQNNLNASMISDNENEYLVKAVRVEGASFENEQSTKQIALQQARQIAFNDLLKYLKYEDLSFDEVNINSVISSYSIVDEYYNENFYSMIVNFNFDKDILKSLIRRTQQNMNGRSEIADYVVVLKEKEDLLTEYYTLTKFLKKEKIIFYPIKIEQEKISVFLKQVDENRIYYSLKELGLNGSIYLN